MENLGRDHWTISKRIYRHLWGSRVPMLFSIKEMEEISFKCICLLMLTRKVVMTTTSVYIFTLFEGAMSWTSKRKQVVSHSSTKEKYIVALEDLRKYFGCSMYAKILDLNMGPCLFFLIIQVQLIFQRIPSFIHG
jgi:hypothetical protein